MKLLGQVLVAVLCICVATAVSIGGVIDTTGGLVSQLTNSAANLVDGLAGSTVDGPQFGSLKSCLSTYNNKINTLTEITATQTQICFAIGKANFAAHNASINAKVSQVNALSTSLQSQLSSCLNEATADAILSCYLTSFDGNVQLLEQIGIQSQLAETDLNTYQNDVTQEGCINAAIFATKAKATIALNSLQACLDPASSVSGNASNSGSSASSGSASGTASGSAPRTASGNSGSSSASSSRSSPSSSSPSSSSSSSIGGQIQSLS